MTLIAERLVARLLYAALVISGCAGLAGCSEDALVTAPERLHTERTTQSEVVVVVPRGVTVEASGCSDGWCLVKWNGRQGYGLAKNLRTRGSAPGPAQDRSEEMEAGEDVDSNSE
ncbi:MAG: SH3 domain-containing protein [Terriglobales bacterium]